MKNLQIENQWILFYKIGAISVLLAFTVMLTEIFLTALPDGARVQLSIIELFNLYNRNWFMGMRYMGLMNIIAASLMLPVYIALYGVHRERLHIFAGISLIISLISFSIFMSDNSSFSFLALAQKYMITTTENERTLLLAAGEALYAKGASHTPGTFPGLFINLIAGMLFSIVILKGKLIRKSVGIIGIVAWTFLIIFEICSSFIKSLWDIAMILAMLGGIIALLWYVMLGVSLWKISKLK